MNEQKSITVSNPKDLLAYLQTSKSAIEMALPKHLNADRMMRLALTSFSTNPALRNCDARSILASIVVASQIGLEPGVAGQGYLIPYKGQCTFVPGWQGLVSLLNNSGRATAWTGAVFDGDHFDFQLGSNPRCNHVPGPNFGDPDKMTWVYACGKVNGSEQPVVEAWPVSRVLKHRDRFNKVGERHYSFAHPEMYARKVVLLQVLKYMPRSIELNNAITASDAAEAGRSAVVDGGVVIDVDSDADKPAPKLPQFSAPPPVAVPRGESPAIAPAIAPQAPPAAPEPETVPESPAEESPAANQAVASSDVSDCRDDLATTLINAGVSFDNFKKWYAGMGLAQPDQVKAWAAWESVPESVAQHLTETDIGVKRLQRCVTLYGKKPTQTNEP